MELLGTAETPSRKVSLKFRLRTDSVISLMSSLVEMISRRILRTLRRTRHTLVQFKFDQQIVLKMVTQEWKFGTDAFVFVDSHLFV